MDNFQSKIQKGLNNVQKGIEEGKNKLQTSQEIVSLRDEVISFQDKRTSLILELGELTYGQMRDSGMDQDLVNSIGNEILDLDKKIFNLLSTIGEKSAKENDSLCECGATLTLNDKFCKECGKKVELFSAKVDLETIRCNRCDMENLVGNKFCNCCGIKLN